ncbi:MAG TPA: carboxylating nicotinate-nucleotide diphosphorylase [Gemmatimonadaceae bacterium]|nr:carboxylating nicotinate-nucleotide diphosphorylase [Gemmatimonadaceae bacterium]
MSPPRRVPPSRRTVSRPDEGVLFPLNRRETTKLVRAALDEDGAFNDVTTIATVVSDRRSRCRLVARQAGVIAGMPLAVEAFQQLNPRVVIRVDGNDGRSVQPGSVFAVLSGSARGLLSAERVALNFLQRLSGIASLTARFVAAVEGTGATILDTRKTTPGWRSLEKYAVRAGGGINHRMDLSSAILIKDNHLRALGGDLGLAVERARDLAPRGTKVEVECDKIGQVKAALAAGADVIMLDNMKVDEMRRCVELVAGRAIVEASGGVSLPNVRAIAKTGVDRISVGALTHSAPSLDLALDFT